MARSGIPNAPVEHKTSVGTITGLAVLIAAWVVVEFVPGAKELAPVLKAALPGLLAVFSGFGAAYQAKHTPRLDEVLQVVQQVLGESGHRPNTVGSAYSHSLSLTAAQRSASMTQPVDFADEDEPYDGTWVASTGASPAWHQSQAISAGDLGHTQPDEFSSIFHGR